MQRLALAASIAAVAAAQNLFSALTTETTFLNLGLVNSSDVYRYLPVAAGYLELENVTAAVSSWGAGGGFPYLWLQNSSVPDVCTPSAPHPGQDLPGDDYRSVVLQQDSVQLCIQTCCNDGPQCAAWVYVPSAPSDFLSCQKGDHCCYLKSAAPNPANNSVPGIQSGTLSWPTNTALVPPIGMRSAVPLGGLGAGALELRADGTFHEVTIQNGSPAGAAKYGVLADAMLGLRVQPTSGGAAVARTVRTHPPAYAASNGVPQIGYSGSYPLSRLAVNDPSLGVSATVFAYSTLHPGNMQDSAYPAVVFTLAASNPTATPQDVSFYFNLPFGAINDCARDSSKVLSSNSTADAPSCMHACATTAGCSSWTWASGAPAGPGVCKLAADIPLSVHRTGSYCGVAGAWSADASSVNLILNPNPPGNADSPAIGDLALRPVLSDGVSPDGVSISFAAADDPGSMWAAFAANGGFSAGGAGISAGPFRDVVAAHGAAAVSATIAPGANATLSIVFAWYFPNRDHVGVNIGNGYAGIWDTASAVAADLAQQAQLQTVVARLNAHHRVWAGALATGAPAGAAGMPDWLADHMINQFSHFRGLIWTRDGRLREFEAMDCPDVDSVHNDGQRHLPYLYAAPEFERNKMREWGPIGQASDGHINEYLGSFGLGPLDQPGGRVMGDTTTMWILETYELYMHTADEAFLEELYPTAVRALNWQIGQAKAIGLPEHLVCTYDIIDFDQYNTTTFNGMMHLAAMKAGVALATAMNDPATAAAAQASYDNGVAAMFSLLWNSTYSYFRAYTGGDAIMADCMYGQVVAHHHGLGWLLNTSVLAAHAAAEWKYNGNPYGLTVVTGRHTAPPAAEELLAVGSRPGATLRQQQAAAGMAQWADRLGVDTQDDTCWLGAGPDLSYLLLAMGGQGVDLDTALEPARRTLANYRSRLNDMWNLVGLTSTGDWGADSANGQPWITSHYGFIMVDYYLPAVLVGQQVNMPAGQLSFSPLFACPFVTPWAIAGTEGTLSCSGTNTYTLTVAFGALQLPAAGLSVAGKAYPQAVALGEGDSVTW